MTSLLNGLANLDHLHAMVESVAKTFPPLSTLPCANVKLEMGKGAACDKPGTKACSACKLVSYCSKECQNAHWKRHKIDCRSHIRSDQWKPSWALEGRVPGFITGDESPLSPDEEDFNRGCTLWGNMPAIDVINLKNNENDATKNISLAFVASGDLRHVIKSVNTLPSNYSGKLDILVNDVNPFVICRNLVLILILGLIPDETLAADIALHFWYSTFLPVEYKMRITLLLGYFVQLTYPGDGGPRQLPYPLGKNSSLTSEVDSIFLKTCFSRYISVSEMSMDDAQSEYNRVRNAPTRGDYRDRMYSNLRPSHRAAFHEYRRFGIILPFGALNAHFNSPNTSLFSFIGKWLQTDYADPLEGWDMDDVLEAGKKHGAQPEDIYGCLYFSLSDQLRTFARRIRELPISFKILSTDASTLPKSIKDGAFSHIGLLPSARFDRIEVANILDINYVGLRGVLVAWSPLLSTGKHAAIVGYFMNWPMIQKDGRVGTAPDSAMKPLIKRQAKRLGLEKMGDSSSIVDWQIMMYNMMADIDALYENSGPFEKYLEKQELRDVLSRTRLVLRKQHKLVPHRLLVPLQASPRALPVFRDDDSWYYHAKLKSSTWVERYVEFSRG